MDRRAVFLIDLSGCQEEDEETVERYEAEDYKERKKNYHMQVMLKERARRIREEAHER